MRKLWTEITKTPGPIKVQLSLLTILAISSVSSTALQISSRVGSSWEDNTSTCLESLEVKVGRFAVRVTGKDTMDRVTNLIPIESLLEMTVSNEK